MEDFEAIKINLNTCIVAIKALIEDVMVLSGAAVSGDLKTRADENKHGGDFSKIIEGINNEDVREEILQEIDERL